MSLGVFVFIFICFSFVSASSYNLGDFPSGDDILIRQTCADCTYINISVYFEDSSVYAENLSMSDIGDGVWTYLLEDVSPIGSYEVVGEGDPDGEVLTFSSYYFTIRDDSFMWKMQVDFSDPLYIILLVVFIIIIGVLFFMKAYVASAFIAIILGFIMLFSGVNYLFSLLPILYGIVVGVGFS